VEEIAEAGGRARGNRDAAAVSGIRRRQREAESEADHVVEAGGEIFAGEADAVVVELLVEPDGPRLAGLGFQTRIAEIAESVIENLVEAWFPDALAVK